jgi:hypothetical protein
MENVLPAALAIDESPPSATPVPPAPTTTAKVSPGVIVILLQKVNAPPPPPIWSVLLPPPPTQTTDIDVTPTGTVQLNEPAVVYNISPYLEPIIQGFIILCLRYP